MVYRSRRRFRRRVRAKKASYRRFRKARRIQRIKNKRTANIFKMTIKKAQYFTMKFFVANTTGSVVNVEKFEKQLNVSDFFTDKHEFWDRLHDYHYVKFNYFIVKFPEMSYCTYSNIISTALAKAGSVGIASFNTDRYPFYVAWDLEQELDFGAQDASFTARELSEYAFVKKVYPNQRRAPYLMWRVPQQWRGYLDTNSVQPTIFTNTPLYNFFASVTGVKNLRSPVNILGGHYNWWQETLPNTTKPTVKPSADDYVFMEAFMKMEFIASVTLRGVKFIGKNS
ncbi:putative capsid protein [Trichonephila clavata]|uniref:Putative capsid protein n=1 Tax=Trichonephila clavata TaxID=2740835 RepID=A0A8X6FTA0_TRICU|nr:putative capsid protein [Trichonephila clavata]